MCDPCLMGQQSAGPCWNRLHSEDASNICVTDLQSIEEQRMMGGFITYTCPEDKAVSHSLKAGALNGSLVLALTVLLLSFDLSSS